MKYIVIPLMYPWNCELNNIKEYHHLHFSQGRKGACGLCICIKGWNPIYRLQEDCTSVSWWLLYIFLSLYFLFLVSFIFSYFLQFFCLFSFYFLFSTFLFLNFLIFSFLLLTFYNNVWHPEKQKCKKILKLKTYTTVVWEWV